MLETTHQPTPLKLTLPSGSEMTKIRWASRTPEHFLTHVRGAIHVIKEMELDVKLKEATEALKMANLDLDIAKATLKSELKRAEGKKSSHTLVRQARSRLTSATNPRRRKEMILSRPPWLQPKLMPTKLA